LHADPSSDRDDEDDDEMYIEDDEESDEIQDELSIACQINTYINASTRPCLMTFRKPFEEYSGIACII
jgi:hypothetical protein